ncbi:uncharacterized protein LOC135088085 [Ostrinia nubilalis]|uniref:uncharacterized protein LOC135088085 n=1 Tax=Ostrinia nubilalis TaxID=29057 RepID=UPI003082556E
MRLDDDSAGDENDASPPKRSRESPTQRQDSPVRKSRESRDSPSEIRDSPNRKSRETRDSPVRRSRDSPVRRSRESRDSPTRKSRDSPHKKPVRFDAPSPNGSTDARVIVSEVVPEPQMLGGGDAPRSASVTSRGSRDSRAASSSDSDEPSGRTRRPRKPVTYKEKPLNRKMRR